MIQFLYPELPPSKQNYWLLIENNEVDLCYTDPGLDVDLYVETDLRTMTAIWMGVTTVWQELRDRRVELTGDRRLMDSMQQWLGLSPFAVEKRQYA